MLILFARHSTWSAFAVLPLFVFASGCSSSSSSPGAAGDSGNDGSVSVTGSCAELQACCANIQNTSDRTGCEFAVANSQNLAAVCNDALTHYAPECAGSGDDASVDGNTSEVESFDSSSFDAPSFDAPSFEGGCGSPGATPVDVTPDCTPTVGACIHPAEDASGPGCVEYSGAIYVSNPSVPQSICEDGTSNTWHAGAHCTDLIAGIQAGCATDPGGVGSCVTVWYGPGCLTGLGASCNGSPNSKWVHP